MGYSTNLVCLRISNMPRKVNSNHKKANALTAKQVKAIELFLNDTKGMNEIAKEVGVSRTVFYKWRTEDERFINELNRQHEIMIRENASRTASNFAFLDAATRKIIADPNVSAKDKAEYIKIAYDVMFRRQELLSSVELRKQYEERILALEEALDGALNNDSQEKE